VVRETILGTVQGEVVETCSLDELVVGTCSLAGLAMRLGTSCSSEALTDSRAVAPSINDTVRN
jgi:hypothetical protein